MDKTIHKEKKCNKCKKVIAYIYRIDDTENSYKFISENTSDRYIDKWGYERNYCKNCIK